VTANDDRARTMHTVAARTERELLSTRVVDLLDRNDQRLAHRAQAWRQHAAQTHVREATVERMTLTRQEGRERERSRQADREFGLEL
jgi:hypothetical protein